VAFISFLADARVKASGGPSPGVDTGQPRQGDDVEQGGLGVAAPVLGEKQVRATVVLGPISLRKKLGSDALQATISVAYSVLRLRIGAVIFKSA
jgi:hypothetical protein